LCEQRHTAALAITSITAHTELGRKEKCRVAHALLRMLGDHSESEWTDEFVFSALANISGANANPDAAAA
jgi:hypothetical protein